ncbi:hypothetical protein U9M48_004051 [Paspalum notatum var. saurae]|uniref:Mitochondrial protein n=1 Tax=Paspalum notatum var. saurae TaxID=547442 RepID=A0AAQ3PTY1_PASNO
MDTPMELHLCLRATDVIPLEDPTRYHHIVGSLIYLGIILSQFMSIPTSIHYGHLLRVLRYLRGTIDCRLFFPSLSSLQLSVTTWGTDSSDFKSISAYCVFLGSSLISWKTKKQTDVAPSSAEAKLCPLAYVKAKLLVDFVVDLSSSTPVHCYNTGAISIAQDPVKHQLTKHIGINCFYVRSAVQDQVVVLHYVPSEL